MKNKIMAILGVFAMLGAVSANGQSTFAFRNYYGNHGIVVKAPVSDANGNLLSGSGYWAELYGGATADSLEPLYAYGGNTVVIRTFGTGNGSGLTTGYVPGHSGDPVSVNTVGNGGFAYLQMVAWDSTLGTTYEEVVAKGMGGYGSSTILYLQGGDPTDVPPGVPSLLYGLQSFSLLPVPEPSSGVLALLGGGIMFWFMRNKTSIKCSAKPIPKWS